MKHLILALLVLSLIAMPVFAETKINFTNPSFEAVPDGNNNIPLKV